MALCNTDTLLAQAACFSCQPTGILQILELQLLCEIANIPAADVCQQVFSGNGDPTGVVVPTCSTALYLQQDSVPANLVWTWLNGGPWVAPIT